MFDDLYPEAAETALATKVARSPEPKPTQRFSMWGLTSAAPKGVAAGAAQAIGSTADVLGAFGSVLATTEGSAGGMFSLPTEAEDKQNREAVEKLRTTGPDYMTEGGRSFRNVAQDYTPDPLTAHAAERMVFDFSRVASKAISSAVALGPIPGAVVAGAEEGFTQSDALAEQGVDLATRSKVGAVTAATNAVSFALPVAGKTVAQTAVLVLAGGPASFIAQNAANREILKHADYSKQADQYDPFDPLGLALSTIIPAGFGALAMRSTRGKKPSSPAIENVAEDDSIDAARTSLLRESVDSSNPVLNDLATAQPHADAHARAIDQMAAGERVSVAEALPEPVAAQATQNMGERLAPLRAALDINLIEAARIRKAADNMREKNPEVAARYDALALSHELKSERDARVAGMSMVADLERLPSESRLAMVDMYTVAAREKPKFDAAVLEIADMIGGTTKLADLKGASRTVDKVLGDYGGDPTKIKDLVRATILTDSAEAAQRAVGGIFEKFEVLPGGRRNLLDPNKEPVDGYRDAKFNVLINGHVAEVQVNLPEMVAAKKVAHPLYEERSKIERVTRDRLPTDAERARIDELNAKMREIYAPAWAEAIKARNSDSSTGAPLRRADSGSKDLGGSVSQASEYGKPGAPSETGMPSTSNNSALPKEAGTMEADFIKTSDASILGENASFYERQVARLASESPDLMVMVEGMDAPKPLSEVMALIKKDLADDLDDAKLIQVAAECFLSTGGV